jgi:hypothetical protein
MVKKQLYNIFFFILLASFGIYAYSGGQRKSITSVIVTPALSYQLINTNQQLKVVVNGTGFYSSAVTWSTNFGYVDKQGIFTAPSITGTAYVTAISNEDHTKSCTVTIIVEPPITSIVISPTDITVQPGQQIQFTATINR